jgi:hypothetical protein
MLQKDVSKRYAKTSQVRGELESVIEQLGLQRQRDLLREYAQEPERVAETLKKKRLSRHMDQGQYFENMGRGKIDDAILEYKRVVYLDPDNKSARDKLKKLEAERTALQTHPDMPPPDADATVVMPAEMVQGLKPATPAARPAAPVAPRPAPAAKAPPKPAPKAPAVAKAAAPEDPAAKTRMMLIAAAAVLVVLIAVVGFVLLRGGGEKTASNQGGNAANPTTPSTGGSVPSGGTPPAVSIPSRTPPPQGETTSQPGTGTVAANEPGSLTVTTDPPQARITVEGKSQGKRSNTTLSGVPSGSVSVHVEKDGYLSQTKSVDVPAGGTGTVAFKLEPNPNSPGTLDIKVSPFATYYINDQPVAANVASTHQTLKPGVYTVRAVHPAFDPKEWKNVRVEPGKTLLLTHDFLASANTGAGTPTSNAPVTLRVTSTPWAEVVVDGQKTGKFTPCELSYPAGSKSVTVVRDGFSVEGGPKTVSLKAGPPVSVSFTLTKK